MNKLLKKIKKGKPSGKEIFKKSKLAVQVNIPKGANILNQKSAFFNKEYEKEKALLGWD